MKKILCFIFLLSFPCLNAIAQSNLSGIVEVNYNTFSHKKLSSLQQQLANDISEVNLRVNDDFGANVGYSIGIKVESIDTQFFASYNATGGKISYSDFSGVIRLTQLVKAYTIGGEYQIKLSKDTSKELFYFGGRGFINYTTLDLESFSSISNITSMESVDFNSIDFGLGIRFIYDIPVSIVKLRFHVGYDLLLGGELKFSDNSDLLLQDNQGDAVRPGWSGFRSGVGIVVPF